MILASPAFERALRRRVRGELRASKELWKEHRRVRRARPRQSRLEPLLRAVLPLIFGGIAATTPTGVPLVLLALALYGAGTCFLRAQGLVQGLYASPDLNVLIHYPAADEDLLRLQWKKFHHGSLWFLYTALVIYLGLVLVRRPGLFPGAAAAGLALLHWAALLGMSAALAAWRPAWPLAAAGKAFCTAAGLLCVFSRGLGPFLPSLSGLGLLAVPTGWASYALWAGVLDGHAAAFLALLPLALLVGLFPLAGRRFLRNYVLGELVYQAPPPAELILESAVEREMVRQSEVNQQLVDDPGLKPLLREELRQQIPDTLERAIRAGSLRRPPEWMSGGPLERVFAASLSGRGRALADFLLGGKVGWTRSWVRSAVIAAVGVGLALLLTRAPAWTIGLFIFLAGLPLLGSPWQGLQCLAIGGGYVPHFALYPLSYWEISSILFRASLLRLLAWVPLLLGLLAAGAPSLGIPLKAALGFVGKGCLIYAGAIPILAILRFSSGSNDTARLGCARLLILGTLGLAVVGAIGGGALLFAPEAAAVTAGAALVLILPMAGWALYGGLLQRGRVDLLRTTPPS